MKKRVLVVGANGSLAKGTIRCLLEDGYRDITMACRTEAKGIKARDEILSSVPKIAGHDVHVVGGFDMNHPTSIQRAIESLNGSGPFGIVFLAAGFPVFADDFEIVEWNGQRIEKQVFQNAMGGHITLQYLRNAGLLSDAARIVVAGGEGARGIRGMIAAPNFSSPAEFRKYVTGGFKGELPYNPMNAIGVSKLCSALWTKKIAMLADGLEVVWFSPGLTTQSVGLVEHLSPVKALMMHFVLGAMKLLGKAQDPYSGGRKFADCLAGKIGRSGELIGAPYGKTKGALTEQSSMNPLFTNQRFIDEYWSIVEETFGPFEALKLSFQHRR